MVESKLQEDRLVAEDLIEMSLPLSGNSFRLGITGIPGVGKSSFIESFGGLLVEKGHKVAVLAIDPSSEKSGGSILGDKTRMEKLSSNKNVFIRPTPSSGYLGGVARNTYETILLCEAAGYDFIVVETVGVGQSETAVKHLTDFFLLLMLSGSGDELQGIKRGIMEMADGILISKADGNNLEKCKVAKAEFSMAIHYLPPVESGWIPFVDVCSSITGLGLDSFYEKVTDFKSHEILKGNFNLNRKNQNIYWFENSFSYQLQKIFSKSPLIEPVYNKLRTDVFEIKINPYKASSLLISKLISKLDK